jgi:predicted enzyme related to lactoylglutathione lyase
MLEIVEIAFCSPAITACARVREHEVEFRREPVATPACRRALMGDPDGNTICLHRRNSG